MPLSPIITIYGPDGTAVPSPVTVPDIDEELSGSYGEEFVHQVYTIKKDHYYALLYGVDFVRKHEPLTIVKQIDKVSVPLMGYLSKGTFLPKVEIRWYQYKEKSRNTEEYFRMTLEHVRLNRIKYTMPNVKDERFERYNHLEELQFMYQKVTWLYTKGYILFTDIWNGGFFSEEDEMDFSEKKEDPLEELEEMVLDDPLNLKFTAGVFEKPQNGFEFDKKAKVKFNFTANRKPKSNENKVYVKLFAVYKGKTENMHQLNEGRLVAEDSWSTEFKLKKPEAYEKDENREADAAVEFYAEIENEFAGKFKGESINMGSTAITLKSMAWKTEAARRGETVVLEVTFENCPENTEATIEIFEYDYDGNHDSVEQLSAEIKGGKLEASWEYEYQDDVDDIVPEEEAQKTGGKYHPPEYFFTVKAGDQQWGEEQESKLLQFKDWIEVELQDENGDAMADEPFELHLPDGSTQNGTLDENGFARVESVHPGAVEVVFTNYPSVTIKE